MKPLLRSSLDSIVSSLAPILSWLLLGVILDDSLANVYAITVPIQCLMDALIAIFGDGANISRYRDKDKHATDNGIFWGIVVSGVISAYLLLNCDAYINFMNMEPEIYHTFCIYSLIQIFCQTVLFLNLNKLYYRNKNKEANKIVAWYNLISFVALIGTALLTRSQLVAASVASGVLLLMVAILTFRTISKITFRLNLRRWFRYDSATCMDYFMMFFVYLFGFSNSFQFGEEYVTAITFSSLVTDTQWDATDAIDLVAKVDLAKHKFNMKKQIKDALKLNFGLILTVLLMSVILYPVYQPSILIAGILIGLHILDFLTDPIARIRMCFLQLEDSAAKNTGNKLVASAIRLAMSFLPTPYCTIIGQISAATYEYGYSAINYRHYKRRHQLRKMPALATLPVDKSD